MPVPTNIGDLSTTAASNSPAGSETPAEGDNHIRAAYAFIAQLNTDKAPKASPTFTGTVTADVLTTTGNTTLGNASTDTLNVGNGGIIKDSSGNVGLGGTPLAGWKTTVQADNAAAPSNASALRLYQGSDGGVAVLFQNAAGTLARVAGGVTGTGTGTDDGTLTFETSINGSLTECMRVKSSGQVRFVPLASDPSNAEAGDVYFNSSTSKLRIYTGSAWADLH